MNHTKRTAPAVSACILTFNNEETLPICLASLAPQVDEIVVVDSGSTDRTCEIARTCGARVVERAFTDYADQRNFGIAQCSREIILMIDSDEFLPQAFVATALRWFARGARVLAVPRRHLVSREPARYLSSRPHYHDWQTRMFRRDPRTFYEGRVHERLRYDGRRVKAADLHLYHLLFLVASTEQRREKSRAYQERFGDGYPRFYVFEDAPYNTQDVTRDWSASAADGLQALSIRSRCRAVPNWVRALSLRVRQLPLCVAAWISCVRSTKS